MEKSSTLVEVEGRKLHLTNLEKEIYPGIPKARIIQYYASMAERILPYLRGRPLTLQLYPDGIGGKRIVRKDKPDYTPEWVKTFNYQSRDGKTIRYIVCEDRPTLIWLANLTNLEFHITLSRTDDFEHPDLLLFDLDPFPPADFRDACRVALLIRDLLKGMGVESYPKTSGATGIHILVGIERVYEFEEIREIVKTIASSLESLEPIILSELKPVSERKGRVMVDFAQNSLGKTITAPFSLKPLEGAPVSTPLRWEELEKGVDPKQFNLETISGRREDPMLPVLSQRVRLDKGSRPA
jgi:bifunctional non-homologous end joining protein LigD